MKITKEELKELNEKGIIKICNSTGVVNWYEDLEVSE